MGPIQRKLVNGVMVVVAHPKLTLVLCALFAVLSIVLAKSFLPISTDENKLFDRDVKFFKDYLQFADEFPENEAVIIVVRPSDETHRPPTPQWTALADQISAKLLTMPKYVRLVSSRVPVNQLEHQGLALVFDDWTELKQHAASAGQFAQLAQLIAGRQGLAEIILGPTPVDRLLHGQGMHQPDAQSIAFMQETADSWLYALDHPDESLTEGHGLPDLAAAEPNRTPRDFGYDYIRDQTDDRPDGQARHIMLINVYQKEYTTSLDAVSESIDAMRQAVGIIAAKYPQFIVEFTGRPVLQADQMKVSHEDNVRAECMALPLIFIGLALMLRSLWLALVAEITLGVGIAWTFGWATCSIGQLNLLSLVFVIALIGIGMDYLIQILTRYRQEAKRYKRPAAIWARVFRYASPPITTACLGAAGAFFVARFTHFQGAAELGVIAGGGLLLCLLAGYTVLPAILVLLPARVPTIAPDDRYHAGNPPKAGGWRLIPPLLWIGMLLAGIPLALKVDFDPEILNLQPQNLPSVKLVHMLPTWYAVVTSPDLEKLRPIRDRCNQSELVASTDSLLDAVDKQRWLDQDPQIAPLRQIQWTDATPLKPGDLARWAGDATGLAETWLRANLSDDLRAPREHVADTLKQVAGEWKKAGDAGQLATAQRMTYWEQAFIDQLHTSAAQFSPPPLDAQAIAGLPQQLRSHYVSMDGKLFALYINPKQDLWHSENLGRFVHEVERLVPPTPAVSSPTGIAIQFYHSTAAIRDAFLHSTIYALALIILLVYIDLRNIGRTLMAISVLALGLPVLLELMVLLGIKWNFANFFGLPILIGAGHEYGVFMIHRYKEVLHDPRRVWRPWDVSDRALLLCAFVTCSSFAFLGLGQHLGIASLGKVMALGVACIYLATVIVLRPLLVWRLKQRKVYEHLDQPAEPED